MSSSKRLIWIARSTAATLALLGLASCGSSDDTQAPVASGVFLGAAPVKGLYYEAHPSGEKGSTDADGKFRFVTGDEVTFYLRTEPKAGQLIKLGAAAAASLVTPIDITRHHGGMLTNVLQVLHSLDADNDLSTGIEVAAGPPDTCNLEDQSGCKVEAGVAQNHFAGALAKFGVPANDTYLGKPSIWRSHMDRPGCLITKNDECYKIKGITYSPAPVGYDASAAPALGDLFWDSFETKDNGTQIYNWYSLWGDGELGGATVRARNDLGNIKDLGVNTIRVYAMLSRQLSGDGQKFTHEQFLDQSAVKGLHVLVDLPLPDTLFWKGKYDQAKKIEPQVIEFWETVLKEIAEELKQNPAVMGFSIMNEKDGDNSAFMQDGSDSNVNTDFFYYQAIQYARKIKEIAPDKLVGWAVHDAPTLVGWASTHRFTDGPLAGKIYFEELAKVFDYWGVNTYQLELDRSQPTLRPVLGNGPTDTFLQGKTYNTLPEQMKRPVIFTEWGWPGTGRVNDAAQGDIIENAQTRQRTADVIGWAFKQAYGSTTYPQYSTINYDDIFAGAFFFSFSHEWWKSGNPSRWDKTPNQTRTANFPNYFWEEEGFGIFKIGELGKKDGVSPWCGTGPCLPYDKLEPMSPMTDALRSVYRGN
ncbi:cellulase family glycosylhydrolase [Ottowia caeni]|uniref:cellulase family glycosylhydrolase n=1 Tax=Ottowia caeni TaxID=2870339 RepID=UPI001E3A9F5F|nr:cellulase family glycosylhydrolase [Ottowia caeni]